MSVIDTLRASRFTVAITGANGWIGRMALALLEEAWGADVVMRVRLFGSCRREIVSPAGRKFVSLPMSEIAKLKSEPTLLLHLAFETKDRVAGYSLDEFIARNTAIDETLETAVRHVPILGLFVPSSGAVYRQDRSIDTDLAPNPYGVLKARQEDRWRAWCKSRSCSFVSVRIFNLSGPYINKYQTYALASILLNLLRGEPIRLRADRPVIRSYVHVRDLLLLVFSLLLDPDMPPILPFDTAGTEDVEIGDLAVRAAAILNRPGHPIERPPLVGGPANRYVGEGGAWGDLSRHNGLSPTPLDVQISDTAEYLKRVCC